MYSKASDSLKTMSNNEFLEQNPETIDPSSKLNKIEEFVRLEKPMMEISKAALAFHEQAVESHEKTGHHDIVTEADLYLEDNITRIIKDRYPEAKVWGEEIADEFGPDSWGIDPLDGTAVFKRKGRDWCIAIARMEQGNPVFSMIVVPMGDRGTEIYTAKAGQGAFLKEVSLDGTEHTRRLRVADTTSLQKSPFAMRQEDVWNLKKAEVTPEDRLIADKIHELSAECSGTNIPGSTSYAMASLAAGRFSVACAGPQSLWDVAMGDLLIREAGGKVTQLNGEPINYMNGGIDGKTSWLASANEELHEDALMVLNMVKKTI